MSVRRALAPLLLGLAALSSSCARKAPGPDECQSYALTLARLTFGAYLTPEIQAQVEEVTRQCLTKPYDHELMRCVLTTGQQQLCLRSFAQRQELGQ
jgi:hypothetical protein